MTDAGVAADRNHQPVPEPIDRLPVSRAGRPGRSAPAAAAAKPCSQQPRLQPVARRRRVAQAELLDRLGRDTPRAASCCRARAPGRRWPAARGSTPRPLRGPSAAPRARRRRVLVASVRLRAPASRTSCASSRTASWNLTFSCSSTNLKTSPPAPHPKQWKNPLSRLTWNDGVFSPWNGQSPFQVAPDFLQRHVLLDDLHDVRLRRAGRR